jgi:hypothetical protein
VKVAAIQQQLTQAYRGVVGVAQKCVLDDDACATTGFQRLDEVL